MPRHPWLSTPSVFSRFGVAITEWIRLAQRLLRLAGLEATAANALVFIDLALRLFGAGAHRMVALAARNPLPAVAAASGLLWWCYHRGYLTRDSWRVRLAGVGGDGGPDAGNGRRRHGRAPDAQ